MSYESGNFILPDNTFGNTEDKYFILNKILKKHLSTLLEEKSKLEEKRDLLKAKNIKNADIEQGIGSILLRSYMDAIWNVYMGIEEAKIVEENYKKTAETYNSELQLMQKISELTKGNQNPYHDFEQREKK